MRGCGSKSDSCVWDTTFLFSCIYDPSSHRVVSVRVFCVDERLDEVGSFTGKQVAGRRDPWNLGDRNLAAPLSVFLKTIFDLSTSATTYHTINMPIDDIRGLATVLPRALVGLATKQQIYWLRYGSGLCSRQTRREHHSAILALLWRQHGRLSLRAHRSGDGKSDVAIHLHAVCDPSDNISYHPLTDAEIGEWPKIERVATG